MGLGGRHLLHLAGQLVDGEGPLPMTISAGNVANLPLGWKDCRGAILKTKIRQTLGCGIIMHATSPAASRETDSKAGQEIDHTACRQMDRGRAGDRSYSMPADG